MEINTQHILCVCVCFVYEKQITDLFRLLCTA